ncbi:MAG: ArnT family glycosyltransferase [Thermoanaerobaculia bacterium]
MMTPAQRRLVWITAILVALTRIVAASRSLWDWDEAQFASALHDFDVAAHHPHPPGFPLFIALAKIVQLLGVSDFHALQAVTIAGAIALFPLMFWLGRELGFSFSTAYFAALLLAFSPNVWFFGGTAFSDVPSLALSLLACALLLRGRTSPSAYLLGALALGFAAGFRPQNLLIGFAPALLATWHRRSFKQTLAAIVIGASTIAAAYGGAVVATGDWGTYRDAVRSHQRYIAQIDSWRSPLHPGLVRVADDFFVRPYRFEKFNVTLTAFAVLGLLAAIVRRRKPLLLALAIFGPFWIVAWLMLDFNSVSRFSIAWMPLVAFAAACGIAFVARKPLVEYALALGLVGWMIYLTAPAIAIVRANDSPPVRAIQWIRTHVPKDSVLHVHGSMGPYADLLLSDYRQERWVEKLPDARDGWILQEGATSLAPEIRNFTYPHNNLWNIARHRYFEVSVRPLAAQATFGDGWYDEEGEGELTWRWMGARAFVYLRPMNGNARLELRFVVPRDILPAAPNITLTWNGQVLDRIRGDQQFFERSYVVASRPDAQNELRIETDRVANPAKQGIFDDSRDLGVRLERIGWRAVR